MNKKRTLDARPGVYTITHSPTGRFYVGSSKKVSTRISGHLSDLRKGSHDNRLLQEIVTSTDDLVFTAAYTETVEEARNAEQELLDIYHGQELCCNIGTGSKSLWAAGKVPSEMIDKVRAHATGNSYGKGHVVTEEMKEAVRRANTGLKRSPETLEKMRANGLRPVVINGVKYDGVEIAAKALGIHPQTLNKRINSNLDEWSEWTR